ncbi:MAG: hypothetical protein K1X66_06630 [Verrucomicrobiae bacterium]|nr:hypothetical protein [Verrucomicrobiae bacterium]
MTNQANKLGGLITRKDFIFYSLSGFLFTCLPAFLKQSSRLKAKQHFSIKPISGVHYKPSFLAFCKRAKFSSVKQAITAVKNDKIPFEISHET